MIFLSKVLFELEIDLKHFLFSIVVVLAFGEAFARDYICLNVRYKNLNLGEHSFISIVKDVAKDDFCSGEFGCSTSNDQITTYSLWGSKFKSWKMFKNKKQDAFGLGDELVLNRKDVNYVRHCKELIYTPEVRDYISQMEQFNSVRKEDLHWGYYYGASQFNCTSFSIEFFNKITGENYYGVSPVLGVETPAILAREIMEKMENRTDDYDLIQKLKGVLSKEEMQLNMEIQRHMDLTGPKL